MTGASRKQLLNIYHLYYSTRAIHRNDAQVVSDSTSFKNFFLSENVSKNEAQAHMGTSREILKARPPGMSLVHLENIMRGGTFEQHKS